MTWALSLVAIIAMSDRTLLTSHARCWIVGSLLIEIRFIKFILTSRAYQNGPKNPKTA
jgi:hypothetical protein